MDLTHDYYREDDINRFKFIITIIPGDIRTILDVGAWDNQFKSMVESHGIAVTAVDKDPHHPDVVHADIASLPFADNTFDAVTALEILEHLKKKELVYALKELERVSKKYIIISVPNQEVPLGADHRQQFDEKKLKNLFTSHRIEIHYYGKRLSLYGIRKHLYRLDPALAYVYNRLCGKKKKEIDNWIISIVHVNTTMR
jgi:hypothetical protein